MVNRDLIEKIKPFLKRKEYISIIGPRQAGKTTLLNFLRNYLVKELIVPEECVQCVTFEDRQLLMEFEKDPVVFVRSFMPAERNSAFYLMIDEFQYAFEGGQKLKLVFDTIKNIKIIITGSSSLDIKAQVGKFMVGRMFNFSLLPFNFHEYLLAGNARLEKIYSEKNPILINFLQGKDKEEVNSECDILTDEFVKEFERFVIWGGYPAVVLSDSEQVKKKLLIDIYNNYVLKDIKTLLELATEKNLFLLSQYLATQIGNIIVYHNLGQAAELEHRKLKAHLNILDETFVCRLVRPFFKNRQKELSKNPKAYFLDLGFRNNLMENMNTLQKRSDCGAIIENACFIRLNELNEGVDKVNFWRTKSGAEVDFVVHRGEEVVPIEIKFSNFSEPKVSKSLMNFIVSFKPRRAVVLTKNYFGMAVRHDTSILFYPVYYL